MNQTQLNEVDWYSEALQTLLLIPRTPCPTPPVPLEKRPVESLSVEEMKQLVRQYQVRPQRGPLREAS